MKVKNLLARISKLDPEMELIFCTEDEGLVPPGELSLLLDFNDDVVVVRGTRTRNPDGRPAVKLDHKDGFEEIAFVNLTSIF